MATDSRAFADALELMHRYFAGLDERDFGVVAACFTLDARVAFAPARFDPVTAELGVVRGRSAIRDLARGVTQFRATTHVLGNLRLSEHPKGARVLTRAVVHAAVGAEVQDRVVTRGLVYRDVFQRDSHGEWLIADRVHSLQWTSAEAP